MSTTTRELIDDYVAAVSDGDFDRLAELVHPNATFGGTVSADAEGAEAFVQGFRNLRPVTLRTEVHEITVDGNHAAVLYDLVTDTPVGSILCAEFLSTADGQVTSSTLLFDWRRWPEVLTEIGSRTPAAGPTAR